jgi:hypothetical protein
MSRIHLAGALALACLSSCVWTAPSDDAGHESWVRMAIPALLGRKPHNLDEVRVLTQMAAEVGREAVADILLNRHESADYWTQVLMDDLQVDREGVMRVNHRCFDTPLLPHGLNGQLLDHLRHADPTAPFCLADPERRAADGGDREPPPPDKKEAEAAPPPDGGGATDGADGATQGADGATEDAAPTGFPKAPSPELEELLDFPWDPQWFTSSADNGSSDHPTPPAVEQPTEAIPLASTEDVDLCPPFNMADVLRAGVLEDDLFPVMRAWLAPMTTFLDYTPGTASSTIRERGGARWLEVYTQRDTMCTRCHTTNFSTTDARPRNDGWDRFPEPAVDLEGTGFGYRNSPNGKKFYGGDGNDLLRNLARNHFRPEQHAPPSSSGLRPWGFDETCVTNAGAGYAGFKPAPPATPNDGIFDSAAVGGVVPSETRGALALANQYRDALDTWPNATTITPPWQLTPLAPNEVSYAANLWSQKCAGCHQGINDPNYPRDPLDPPDLAPIISRISHGRLIDIMMNGSSSRRMAGQISNGTDAVLLLRYIRNNLRGNGVGQIPFSPQPMFEDGGHALLVLMAQAIVHDVVAEVQGRGLVVGHGFARNEDTLDMQEYLTGALLEDWSLKAVLKEIVLSGAFNRKAPVSTTHRYELPQVSNPWSEVYPLSAAPPDRSDLNSVGDDVHRYSVVNLMESLHGALGWPKPNLGIWSGDYWLAPWPRADLQRDIGRYNSAAERGLDDVDFANLLAWEATVDRCTKPNRARMEDVELVPWVNGQPVGLVAPGIVGPTGWRDWIDRFAEEAHGAATVEQAVIALKERLLTQTTLTPDERTKISTLLGVPLTATFSKAAHTSKLRTLCGVLVKTPQFMLGGLAPETGRPPSPTPHVCLDGEPCTENEICQNYAANLRAIGVEYDCPPAGPLGQGDPPGGN